MQNNYDIIIQAKIFIKGDDKMQVDFNLSGADIANFEHVKYCKKNILQYSLGGLMYSPATNKTIADAVISRKYKDVRSLALCLEDAVSDDAVEEAEEQLVNSLEKIYNAVSAGERLESEIPMIFIRVRNSVQIERIYRRICGFNLLTGFIFPKFTVSNAIEYINAVGYINRNTMKPVYFMPILETSDILDIDTRAETLKSLKKILDSVKELVLNVRIGGNDFCNIYGFRRNVNQTIYDIAVIRDVIADIVNVFGADYVISAPVWEYFGNSRNDDWRKGLINELELDRLNGLIGKTAVHPTQVPIINNSLCVDKNDYFDAVKILNWKDKVSAVSKSTGGDRMNEQKVHEKWAEKIIALSCIYGVK